jgi:hypothetical protein
MPQSRKRLITIIVLIQFKIHTSAPVICFQPCHVGTEVMKESILARSFKGRAVTQNKLRKLKDGTCHQELIKFLYK